MKARFNFPTRILFGEGTLSDLPGELGNLGAHRVLVVSDKGLVKAGIVDRVTEVIDAGGLEHVVYDQVSPNPTGTQVDEGAGLFRGEHCDAIIGVGGGSPMDAAKAIQLRIHHRDPLREYDDLLGGDAKVTGPLPPLVALPTTSGTGSEVSRSAVVTLEDVGRKVVIFSPRLMPSVALCDPELTYGLPARITAETGMDALSHNLEAYLSKGYHPMADAIALQGIAMVGANLARAVADGGNREARREMMMASTMGAVAFQKGLGVIHSLAHALGAVAGVAHGLANAVIMPHAMRFNAAGAPERLTAVAKALGAGDASPEGAARAVEDLLGRIGLPGTLGQAGVSDEHFEDIVDKAMADGCHGQNPLAMTRESMATLLRTCFGG